MIKCLAMAFALLAFASASRAETVRVGLAFSPAGMSAAAGAQLRNGFELGLRHAGAMFGDHQLALSTLPDGEGTEAARIEAFVKQEAPRILVTLVPRDDNLATLKAISDAGVMVIRPGFGGSELAGKRCLANVFVLGAEANQHHDVVAQYADMTSLKRVVVVHSDVMGKQAEVLSRSAKTPFLRLLGFPDNEADYSSAIAKVMLDQPQTIVLLAPVGMTARFVAALRATPGGRDITIISSAASEESHLAEIGHGAPGLLAPGNWATALEGVQNTEFVTAFEQAFGQSPSTMAVYGYDAARLIGTALSRVQGTITPVALRDAMHSANIESPRGTLQFSNNNFPIQDFYMKRIEAVGTGYRSVPVAKVFAQFGDDYAAECPLR